MATISEGKTLSDSPSVCEERHLADRSIAPLIVCEWSHTYAIIKSPCRNLSSHRSASLGGSTTAREKRFWAVGNFESCLSHVQFRQIHSEHRARVRTLDS